MAADPPRIVFVEPYDANAVEFLGRIGKVTVLPPVDEENLRLAVKDCHAILVRSHVRITRSVLQHAARLKVIGRAGVGLDNIDLPTARERGIIVVHTPHAATEAVADLTVGLILSLLRRIAPSDAAVRDGGFFEQREANVGREMSELVLGIIGLGRIGRAVARRCRYGFGMSTLYHDIVDPGWLDFAAKPVSKEELYAQADIISLHVPLTEHTRSMIDAAALAKFQTGALLVNTSRGAVVDAAALARALAASQLSGAALDVFDPEPPSPDHPILSAPNTLFTPHIGARTRAGLARMNAVVEDVARVLKGQAPRYPA